MLPDLLHEEETRVWSDQAYRDRTDVIWQWAPKAKDFTNRRYRHEGIVNTLEREKSRRKSQVRAKVGHALGVIMRIFGLTKVRYRGLEKNTHYLFVVCALANLTLARKGLLRPSRRGPSAKAAKQPERSLETPKRPRQGLARRVSLPKFRHHTVVVAHGIGYAQLFRASLRVMRGNRPMKH